MVTITYQEHVRRLGRIRLKVKIKSLAAEAKIIRDFERKKVYGWTSLRAHRMYEVRREQRDSLIAYAYLRGKPYTSVENVVKREPNWENVRKIVQRFGEYGVVGDLEAWRKRD